tara:strand:+ start:375 stop:1016 length:642 start_codon:yes stop_codon:yes gene_type:complete
MVGYSAECIKCGVVFRKRTNKGNAICDDCVARKVKNKNMYHQSKKLSNRQITEQAHLPSRIDNVELRLDDLEYSKAMTFDAVMIELKMKMKEACAEIIDEYLVDNKKMFEEGLDKLTSEFEDKTTALRTKFDSKLLSETLQEFENKWDEKLYKIHGQLGTISTRVHREMDVYEGEMDRLFKAIGLTRMGPNLREYKKGKITKKEYLKMRGDSK